MIYRVDDDECISIFCYFLVYICLTSFILLLQPSKLSNARTAFCVPLSHHFVRVTSLWSGELMSVCVLPGLWHFPETFRASGMCGCLLSGEVSGSNLFCLSVSCIPSWPALTFLTPCLSSFCVGWPVSYVWTIKSGSSSCSFYIQPKMAHV